MPRPKTKAVTKPKKAATTWAKGQSGNLDGRPAIELDTTEVEKLCKLQATQAEIASWFGVTTRTVEKRVADQQKTYPHPMRDEHGHVMNTLNLTFKEIMEAGYAKGRISLRRKQFQLAEAGSAAMCIFLGKNLLGQRDNIDTNVTGSAQGFTLQELLSEMRRVREKSA